MRLRRMHIKADWMNRLGFQSAHEVFTRENFERLQVIYDPMPVGASTIPFFLADPLRHAFSIEFTYADELTRRVPRLSEIPEVRVNFRNERRMH